MTTKWTIISHHIAHSTKRTVTFKATEVLNMPASVFCLCALLTKDYLHSNKNNITVGVAKNIHFSGILLLKQQPKIWRNYALWIYHYNNLNIAKQSA
jgi:hypothetical protein